jgi:hypothetical protein
MRRGTLPALSATRSASPRLPAARQTHQSCPSRTRRMERSLSCPRLTRHPTRGSGRGTYRHRHAPAARIEWSPTVRRGPHGARSRNASRRGQTGRACDTGSTTCRLAPRAWLRPRDRDPIDVEAHSVTDPYVLSTNQPKPSSSTHSMNSTGSRSRGMCNRFTPAQSARPWWPEQPVMPPHPHTQPRGSRRTLSPAFSSRLRTC